jgi:two-component system, sensor histidine kinase RegB
MSSANNIFQFKNNIGIANARGDDPAAKQLKVGRLRLRTLVALRWLAIVGQTISIAIISFWLGFDLPLTNCFSAIAASAWFNIVLAFALPSQRMLKQWEAAGQLAFDILQLAFLVYVTGGIANPFALLLIAPATIAASTLRIQWVAVLITIVIACVYALYLSPYPLPWNNIEIFTLSPLYKIGLTIALITGVIFTSAYAWRVAAEELRLADALIATQAILSREQRLAAVGGLAAAAAHELGTPLATIQLTAKEMTRALPKGPDLEDAQLILEQSLRCREILRNLSAHNEVTDPTIVSVPIGLLLREAAQRHSNNSNKAIVYDIMTKDNEEDIIVARMPEIIYGLGNFIENAISYGKEKITISASWDSKYIKVKITDDGRGFDPDILPRIGEPYVSTRGQGTLGAQLREGLGLGFFIAKTLLERSGAQISFGNQTNGKTGAIVRVVWSRDDIEIKS